MQKSYFEAAKTAEDLKAAYHTWCKALHPDNGGNAAEFIAMRAGNNVKVCVQVGQSRLLVCQTERLD